MISKINKPSCRRPLFEFIASPSLTKRKRKKNNPEGLSASAQDYPLWTSVRLGVEWRAPFEGFLNDDFVSSIWRATWYIRFIFLWTCWYIYEHVGCSKKDAHFFNLSQRGPQTAFCLSPRGQLQCRVCASGPTGGETHMAPATRARDFLKLPNPFWREFVETFFQLALGKKNFALPIWSRVPLQKNDQPQNFSKFMTSTIMELIQPHEKLMNNRYKTAKIQEDKNNEFQLIQTKTHKDLTKPKS